MSISEALFKTAIYAYGIARRGLKTVAVKRSARANN